LLYAHIHHLTEGRAIAWWHWIAPISQFGFQAVMFVQSMATKALVFENFHRPFLAPLEDGALFLLLLAYVILCARLFRRYRQWIIPRRANIAPLVRLRSPLAALLGFFLLWSSLALFERLVRSLDYFDEFPAYVALAILTLWIAFEAWRHADHSFPVMATRDTTDWVARGRAWHAQLAASEWWRDSALDANALARNLGTNTTHLSRAFNEGLGKSLPQILNEVRCEAVKAELLSRDGQDYLTLALDAGFGSKASFNRAFKAHTGQTPSQWQSARLKN
jgi:AraC-like DNA-binding protein